MPTKEERAAEAKKHVGLARGVFGDDAQASAKEAKIYEDGVGRELPLPEPRFDSTTTEVVWGTLANAIENASGKVCVVDPASYRTPGGNYLSGGWSPECQICAESNLFPALEALKDTYYAANGQSTHGGLYSDRAAYIPNIVFTTEGVVKKRDVLVIAPPNRRFALENHRSEAECDLDLRNRIEAMMRIAAANEPDTLILGAFGCGSFGNDDQVVADLFKKWLDEHPGLFERVAIVISGGPGLDVFRAVFPPASREPEPTVEDEEEVESEEDETIDVAPTSDGRWVFD